MNDPVGACLDEIRERVAKVERYRNVRHEDIISKMESSRDVPRLLAAVEAVLALHVRSAKPAKYYEHCPDHAFDPETRSFGSFDDVVNCPDCTFTEHYLCAHCSCPNDEWECPTYQAITAALVAELADGDPGG